MERAAQEDDGDGVTHPDLPTAEGLAEAVERVARHVAPTPLVRSETLSRMFGLDVHLKIETVSPIGSFKLRGALNCVAARGAEASSIVTSSTGNHGQGVAYAARLVGKPCVVYLPEHPNREKQRKIEALGATTRLVGHDLDIAKDAARAFAEETGGLFVDDGEDRTVMEGAGTLGVEVGAALPRVDYLVVPMGGGNLAAGSAAGVKLHHPDCQVIAVQSSDAPAMHDSFVARRPVERRVETVAECLAQRVPAALALAGVLRFVDRTYAVPDDDLCEAASTLALYGHLLAEPGAAAPIAALARHRDDFTPGATAVVAITGANLDRPTLDRLLAPKPCAPTRAPRP